MIRGYVNVIGIYDLRGSVVPNVKVQKEIPFLIDSTKLSAEKTLGNIIDVTVPGINRETICFKGRVMRIDYLVNN